MSDGTSPDVKSARAKEFMQLLPLTLAIAGLPDAPASGLLFTADQMEARVLSLRTAFKLAKSAIRDVAEGV